MFGFSYYWRYKNIDFFIGVILACEKESTSKLLEKSKNSEKIYKIDSNIAAGVGGLAADANLLIEYAREFSQNYYYKYKSLTPVENIVRYISDVKQVKTQFGSTRPYGAGFLFAGWDKIHGYQLYNTEPSGVYNTWKAHAIGQNYQSAQSSLKQYYEDKLSLTDGLKLTVKVLKKTLDKNKMAGENIDIFVLQNVNGVITQKFTPAKDIDSYLKIIEQEEAEEKLKSDKNKGGDLFA
jgi:20S proteasome subunit alpha 3